MEVHIVETSSQTHVYTCNIIIWDTIKPQYMCNSTSINFILIKAYFCCKGKLLFPNTQVWSYIKKIKWYNIYIQLIFFSYRLRILYRIRLSHIVSYTVNNLHPVHDVTCITHINAQGAHSCKNTPKKNIIKHKFFIMYDFN